MARRKDDHLLNLVADAPWPVGVLLGLAVFFGLREVIGPMLAASGNATLAALGKAVKAGGLGWIPWVLLAAFWLAALASLIKHRHRRRLLQTQTGLDSVRAMGWPDFEKLVGEAFRQQGYRVQETGLGGADGGVDLLLRRGHETVLVQCKQWRRRKVDVRVVREMFGLMTHHGAQRVTIVSVGDFTSDARRFAEGKPIELLHGEALLALVRAGQARTETVPDRPATRDAPVRPLVGDEAIDATAPAPSCPRCGTAMVKRSNRRTGDAFWGCPAFPGCRGTRAIP